MDIGRLKMNIRGAPASPFEGPEGAFDEVAAHVGAPLPKSYIEFIRETDGGHPELSCFTPDKTNPNNVFGVDTFYSFSNPNGESIRRAIEGWGEVLGDKKLPIGSDGGGNQWYLDLCEPDPGVWVYLHDSGPARVKIAENFEQLIAGLETNPDFI